jgi:hypothetical protein
MLGVCGKGDFVRWAVIIRPTERAFRSPRKKEKGRRWVVRIAG